MLFKRFVGEIHVPLEQGRNHVLNIGGDQFLYIYIYTHTHIYIYIYALIDARTHIITRTQRLVNTTPRLLL